MVWQLLTGIYVSNWVHLCCFSFLAYLLIKRYGGLPFELVGCFAVGTIVLLRFESIEGLPPAFPQCAAALGAFGTGVLIRRLGQHLSVNSDVFGIIASLCILTGFNFVTNASPVSILYPGRKLLYATIIILIVIATSFHFVTQGPFLAALRLGQTSKWAVKAWLREVPEPRFAVVLMSLAAWSLVIWIPASTTGVASQTIFMDSTVAILVAKAVASRHPSYIFLVAALAILVRTWIAYTFAGPFGTVGGDAAVIVSLAAGIGLKTKLRHSLDA